MALLQVNIDHTSLAFSEIQEGTTPATLTVTFTNSSSPSASIDVDIVALAAPFSIAVGDEAFTLASNGASHGVVVTFTPTAAGSFTEAMEISTPTVGAVFNPAVSAINLSGSAWSNIVNLLDTIVPAGTISVQMEYDSSLGKLVSKGFQGYQGLSPTQNLLQSVSEHVEKVDVKMGVYEYDALTIQLIEDYDVYSQGLWYKIFRGAPLVPITQPGVTGATLKFLITMTEGGTKRFVTYGRVDPQSVKGTEFALTVGENVRGFEMQVVSGLDLLKMIISSALCISCNSHITGAYTTHAYGYASSFVTLSSPTVFIKLMDVIAEAIALSFDQSFSSTDVQLRNEDIQVGNGPGAMISFANAYMCAADMLYSTTKDHTYLGNTLTGTISSTGTSLVGTGTLFTTELAAVSGVNASLMDANGQRMTIASIFDNTHATLTEVPLIALSSSQLQRFYFSDYWGVRFGTALDIVQAICQSFGLVPRYYFGQADGSYLGDGSDRHRIELLTRGRALNFIVPSGNIISSENHPMSPYQTQGVQASFVLGGSGGTSVVPQADTFFVSWGSRGFGNPPASVHVDVNIVSEFSCNPCYQWDGSFLFRGLIYMITSGDMWSANYAQYYDYISAATIGPTITRDGSSDGNKFDPFIQYLADYFWAKFHGQSSYEREYGDVRANDPTAATTTQWNLRPLRRHQITDEIGTRNYYAIEVRKDYFKNRAKVTWFEE